MTDMQEAKKLINEFLEYEYGERDEFRNPEYVLLASEEYDNGWEVVVIANLLKAEINVWLDERVLLLRSYRFGNLRNMIEMALRYLDYDRLIYVSFEEWRKVDAICRVMQKAFVTGNATDAFKMLTSMFPVVWEYSGE